VSLWPFPTARLQELAGRVSRFLVVEMNAGQMLEDVRLAVGSQVAVRFYGRMGGVVPMTDEILAQIEEFVPLTIHIGSPLPTMTRNGLAKLVV
jgi:2-oxoglutarate ferredoxin oxidoreductase subunit alpha